MLLLLLLVQITSMHVHVYVDAVPRADRDDVRQICRGDWIALMQHEDLPAEEDPQCQTWDFAVVMNVRQHVNQSGITDNNIASLTTGTLSMSSSICLDFKIAMPRV